MFDGGLIYFHSKHGINKEKTYVSNKFRPNYFEQISVAIEHFSYF